MPVPVPRVSPLPAHPVYKHHSSISEDGVTLSRLHRLSGNLPVSPSGPPPSFSSREEWINSLPSWRRAKPRRIWEDDLRAPLKRQLSEQFFQQGLASADNASAIKGQRAQACTPPMFHHSSDLVSDTIAQPHGGFNTASYECARQIMPPHYEDVEMKTASPEYPFNLESNEVLSDDDLSPGRDASSSPIEPVTPFADYVDRAIAAAEAYPLLYATERPEMHSASIPHLSQQLFCQENSSPGKAKAESAHVKAEAVIADTPSSPPFNDVYKKLAQPLSEWLADYMWKVCISGSCSPPSFRGISTSRPSATPTYLASSIHSLLLSTLLQPSAIFLALRYVVRLPVAFDYEFTDDAKQAKEMRFRRELLGDAFDTANRAAIESSAPFRLFVLGCMLANKWLDDHTFSNKTWHSISNIPIQSINRLEMYALGIFSHDLAISRDEWIQWLGHIKIYHRSLSSGHIQPISRPSANPHAIILKAVDELIQASHDGQHCKQPTFLGLEQRKQEQALKAEEEAKATAALDIDLDEDGPLREEYKPKRRVSSGSLSGDCSAKPPTDIWSGSVYGAAPPLKMLPPPAKWSPAGDEPILRERNGRGLQMPIQPPLDARNSHYMQNYGGYGYGAYDSGVWAVHGYIPAKPAQYAYDPHYYQVGGAYPTGVMYSHVQPQSFARTYSYLQPHFEHQCSDIRSTAAQVFACSPPTGGQWGTNGSYTSVPLAVPYQPAWIRA